MKSLSALICSCVLLVSAMAENVPSLINYQGRLTEQNGTALSNGVYRIAFRIWDGPTAPTSQIVWGREYDVVLRDGAFNVILGDAGNPIAGAAVNDLAFAFDGEERYLGLTIQKTPTGPIANPNEIVPRQRLLSTPFAITAQRLVKEAAEQLSPPGTVIAWMGTNNVPPAGWLFCQGQEVSRIDPNYTRLFSMIGTTYGSGDGTTTFNIPDLRGLFLRGAGQNSDPSLQYNGDNSRSVGSKQGDQLQDHSHQSYTTHGGYAMRYFQSGRDRAGLSTDTPTFSELRADPAKTSDPISGTHGDESRPKNIAVQYLIKL